MPRSRPQLSITLPRSFTFHYSEGEGPKTPEREIPASVPQSPRPEGPYRIKRRSRPAVSTLLQDPNRATALAKDVPIPSIETPIVRGPSRALPQHPPAASCEGYLAPAPGRKFSTLPRTPEPLQRPQSHSWNSQQDIGESIIRPLSTCSILSDSSDESQGSLTSFPAGDGSCTSPESDAPDPFRFASIKKGKAKHWAALARNSEEIQSGLTTKKTRTIWTSEMDRHLWTTYLVYIQDPTVTPFKMLPGVAPPLGVCHRVAREARRSWRGGRALSRTPSSLLSPICLGEDTGITKAVRRPDSPDTIRAVRSGTNTPTELSTSHSAGWPKSGSSTRRRLRLLSKRKAAIAPHYQRLLQSRSPSPLSSATSSISRSQSRLSEISSPLRVSHTSSFNTRDVQISLTASTADTMQPDGPLAQLAVGNQSPSQQPRDEWFNEPPVPFASEIPIPSDATVGSGSDSDNTASIQNAAETPRLGSPFGYHTWGPSRSKQRLRPSTPRMQSSEAGLGLPSLRSPLRMYDTMPYPGIHKRRARHQLEEELSPGGSNMQQELIENLFGSPSGARHRRVRSRGFSLGDVKDQNPLEFLFTPPGSSDQPTSSDAAAESRLSDLEPKTPLNPTRRLDSPFHGVAPRPTRRAPRHMATMSLGAYDPNIFSSIGEALGQSESGDNTIVQ